MRRAGESFELILVAYEFHRVANNVEDGLLSQIPGLAPIGSRDFEAITHQRRHFAHAPPPNVLDRKSERDSIHRVPESTPGRQAESAGAAPRIVKGRRSSVACGLGVYRAVKGAGEPGVRGWSEAPVATTTFRARNSSLRTWVVYDGRDCQSEEGHSRSLMQRPSHYPEAVRNPPSTSTLAAFTKRPLVEAGSRCMGRSARR